MNFAELLIANTDYQFDSLVRLGFVDFGCICVSMKVFSFLDYIMDYG